MKKILYLLLALFLAFPNNAHATSLSAPEIRREAMKVIEELRSIEGNYFIVLKNDLAYKASFPYGGNEPTVRLDACLEKTWVGPGRFDLLLEARIVRKTDDVYSEVQERYDAQCVVAREQQAQKAKETMGWGAAIGTVVMLLLLL